MTAPTDSSRRPISDEDQRRYVHQVYASLPDYPFYPCQACAAEGFKVTGTACKGDHTVGERARAMHPGFSFEGGRT